LIDDKKIESTVSRILSSDQFQERDIYKTLLTYLVDASRQGITPKEVTIAHDVFNKGSDFNAAEDTTVRVHMHNLRKKLDQYYQGEGQTDDIQLYIPKGHYRVKFVKADQRELAAGSKKISTTTIVLLALLCIATIYIAIDTFSSRKKNPYFESINSTDAIWGHFFENGYATSVVIGDFLVFHEYHQQLQRPRRIQDYEINTEEELNEYMKAYPEKNPENWFLGELPHNILTNIIDLHPVFLSFKQNLKVNFTTEIDIDFIKKRNIIYIGEFKNLRALADLITFLPVNYETLPWWHGKISFNLGDSIVTLQTSHDWGISRYVVDLALVSKLPGQNNENYLIIAGFGYNSQVKAVEILSHRLALEKLEEQIKNRHGYVPSFFSIVLEVTGFDRASTNAEIKFFHEVEKDYYQKYHYPTYKN